MLNFYSESISSLLNQFNSDLKQGLSLAEVEKSRTRHGKNEFSPKKNWQQFKAPLWKPIFNWKLLILAIAVAVGFYTLTPISKSVAIGGILIFQACWICFVALRIWHRQKLREVQLSVTVSVIRQGKQEKCLPADIVPGDLIFLRAGDYIPADARIVEADGLKVDESALFGSSGPTAKTSKEITEVGCPPKKQTNMVFGGTYVDIGFGKAIVVRTGNKLEMWKDFGKARPLPTASTTAEAEVKLFKDTLIGTGVVIGAIAAGLYWWNEASQPQLTWEALRFGLIFAIAATPNDVMALVHLIFDQKAAVLLKKGIALRHPHYLEKLNRITTFCANEKGIESTKALAISNLFVDEQVVERSVWENWLNFLETQPPEKRTEVINDIPHHFQIPQDTPGLMLTAGLGTYGEQYHDRTDATQSHQRVIQKIVEHLGYQLDDIKANMPLVAEYPWTANFGYEMHVFESAEDEYLNIIFGEAFNVLEACKFILVNGETVPFHYDQYEMCLSVLGDIQHTNAKVYGVASDASEIALTPREVQGTSTLLGFIAFSHSDNEETRQVVRTSLDAGLKVILITESDEQTTIDFARELGIIHTRKAVGTRQILSQLSTQEFDKEVLNWGAYSQPTQEQRRNIVLSLKRHGHTVGFLGESTVDQRAMTLADLAFANMMHTSHLAQDHADCLVLEKGFRAIKDSLFYAREAYQNLAGSLRWCFSCTLAQLLTVVFGLILYAIFGAERFPLTLMQIIWVQFLTTGLSAIGLGTEKILTDAKQHRPGKTTTFLPKTAVFDVICRGLVISLMTITHFLVLAGSATPEQARTAACTTLIFAQVAAYFQCVRYPWESLFKRMFANIRLLGIFIIIIGIHIAAMSFEPTRGLLSLTLFEDEWIMTWLVTSLCCFLLLLLPLNLAINPRQDGR